MNKIILPLIAVFFFTVPARADTATARSVIGPVSSDLAAIALGDPYDVPVERKEIKVDPTIFDAYVGEYELKPKRTITVTRKDDAL